MTPIQQLLNEGYPTDLIRLDNENNKYLEGSSTYKLMCGIFILFHFAEIRAYNSGPVIHIQRFAFCIPETTMESIHLVCLNVNEP